MIPIIPYQRWTLHTSLSPEVALRRLQARVARKRVWFGTEFVKKNVGDFEGTVSENEFYLNRILWYSNTFTPMFKGRFFPEPDGLRIELVATPHPVVAIIT